MHLTLCSFRYQSRAGHEAGLIEFRLSISRAGTHLDMGAHNIEIYL